MSASSEIDPIRACADKTQTVGCHHTGTVEIYDSLCGCHLGEETLKLISHLMHSKLLFMNVHRQSGYNDCGAFALAYATSICYGNDSSMEEYNQSTMRSHAHSSMYRN